MSKHLRQHAHWSNFLGFLFGYDTGQISGIQEMASFKEAFATETGPDGSPAFNSWYLGIIVAFLSVGTFFGVLAGAPIADKFGRRLAMVVDVIVFCIGVIIQVTAFDAWLQVAWGRLISGIGVGALSAAVPLYQSESLPSQMRGTLVATYQVSRVTVVRPCSSLLALPRIVQH